MSFDGDKLKVKGEMLKVESVIINWNDGIVGD
jgi:hypothetical protein